MLPFESGTSSEREREHKGGEERAKFVRVRLCTQRMQLGGFSGKCAGWEMDWLRRKSFRLGPRIPSVTRASQTRHIRRDKAGPAK